MPSGSITLALMLAAALSFAAPAVAAEEELPTPTLDVTTSPTKPGAPRVPARAASS